MVSLYVGLSKKVWILFKFGFIKFGFLNKSKSFDLFRRTRATNLYQNDVSLELVSRILSHSSTQTTRVYAKPSLEMLKSAMDKSPYVSHDEKPLWIDDEAELAKMCGLR